MRAYERLLNYVVVRTPSDENCENVPSSQCQFDLAKILVEELKQLGIDNAYVNDKCFVYAKLPATPGYEDKTKLGFIAHMDTLLTSVTMTSFLLLQKTTTEKTLYSAQADVLLPLRIFHTCQV